jgi:hypothetical protein
MCLIRAYVIIKIYAIKVSVIKAYTTTSLCDSTHAT